VRLTLGAGVSADSSAQAARGLLGGAAGAEAGRSHDAGGGVALVCKRNVRLDCDCFEEPTAPDCAGHFQALCGFVENPRIGLDGDVQI
jgi:hypothetical protein